MRIAEVGGVSDDKPAVVLADGSRVVTYGELEDESNRLAHLLRERGIGPGDRVAVLLDNDPRYLTVCWAARRIGAYYVPINWHLTADEMEYIVSNSGARILIANAVANGVAQSLRSRCSRLKHAISIDTDLDGFEDLDAVLDPIASSPLDDETRGDDIIYTSGTTGLPKGGVRPLTHASPAEPDSITSMVRTTYAFDDGVRYLTPGAPLYHAAPLRFSLAVTHLGGTNILMPRFDAEQALAAIERHSVTHSQWVPTMFIRLLRLDVSTRQQFDLSSQRLVLHAAAPCPIWVKEQMIDWWGPIITEYYGASDGGGATMITTPEWLEHRGSVGRSIVGKFHILDADGDELPAGEPGNIYVEGGIPVGYLDDPDKTARAHNDRGWATVGDVGYLDEDGYLYLTDRQHNVINSGGVNIYPQEIENVLSEHPLVVDVAVFGVTDDEFGEAVTAVVQLAANNTGDEHASAVLLAYCRTRLAGYKCPRSVTFMDELPRGPSGKLYKRRLKQSFEAGRRSSTPPAGPGSATSSN